MYYQAMVEDLVKLDKKKGNLVEQKDDKGKIKTDYLVANEQDAVWLNSRFLHLSDASFQIQKEFKYFMENNTAYKFQKGKGGTMDLNKMKEID